DRTASRSAAGDAARQRRRYSRDTWRDWPGPGAGGNNRLHCFCRGGATQDSGKLREASCRKATGWWAADDNAFEAEYGRRHSGDFCLVCIVDATEPVFGVSTAQRHELVRKTVWLSPAVPSGRSILRADFPVADRFLHLLLCLNSF